MNLNGLTHQRTSKLLVCGLLVFALLHGSALSQVTSSVFSGLVEDATGLGVAGVIVTVRNVGTNETRTAVTNVRGLYRVSNIVPGNYELKAELSGFKTAVNSDVSLAVGEVKRVDLTLETGEMNIVVSVIGSQIIVNTEKGQLSSLVEERQILDLPLNGRNVYTLIRLAPGTVNTEGITFFGGESGGFGESPAAHLAVNGIRQSFNGFLVDGVTNRNFSTSGAYLTPAVDAVAEFRLETSNFSAEFGC